MLNNLTDLESLSKEELIALVKKHVVQVSDVKEVTSNVFSDLPLPESGKIVLDGNSLTPEDLVIIGYHPHIKVELSAQAWELVLKSRQVIEDVISSEGYVCYGINTGFGNFANVIIPNDEIKLLQENLIRSHAAGVGEALGVTLTRMLLALRINILAKGHSGIRKETLETMLLALNKNCIPVVPAQGTVGASGDLAPLSHLALGMMGEGDMHDPSTGRVDSAKAVLSKFDITPIVLQAKEGLALINGTQLITALGADALVRAQRVANTADVVAAISVEALRGTVVAFAPMIHCVRPHTGQMRVAARVCHMLTEESAGVVSTTPGVANGRVRSTLAASHTCCGKVQDSYTLRCTPQVHGISHDTIQFVRGIITVELNSATDNPMIFPDYNTQGQPRQAGEHGLIVSGGNFHGEYPAKALDYLAIGVHELANIAERRIERFVNPVLSGLPAFLTNAGGLNSGFMIAHCTAASLVSENKVLCHPASIDSISTSAAQEDHVSMGGYAARKARQVVEHVERVVAIELLCACQALSLQRPHTSTQILEQVHDLVRTFVDAWEQDRFMHPDLEQAWKLVNTGKIWATVKNSLPQSLQ